MRFAGLVGFLFGQNFVDPSSQLALRLLALWQLFVELILGLHLPILTILNGLVKEPLEIELADSIGCWLQHVRIPDVQKVLHGRCLQRFGDTFAKTHEAEPAVGAFGSLTEVMIA